MDKQFDELSKYVAEGVCRREPVRKFGIGLVGALLAMASLLCASQVRAEDLFVSSRNSNQILRFDTVTGFQSVFVSAGSGGLNLPAGLAFGPDGNLYVISSGTHQVLRYSGADGSFLNVVVNGLSPNAVLDDLAPGLAFDTAGTMYVSDPTVDFGGVGGGFIRKYRTDGTSLGFLATSLWTPTGLAFDQNGNLIVCILQGNSALGVTTSVRRFNPITGALVNVIAADPVVTAPFGVAVDASGNVFVSDTFTTNFAGHDRIISFDVNNNFRGVLAQGSFSGSGPLVAPRGLAFDSTGSLYAADYSPGFASNNILKYQSGQPVLALSSGPLNFPSYMAFRHAASGVQNVTSKVQITRSAFTFNFSTNTYVQRAIIKNISTAPISGPISLVLDNLSSNASLASSNGSTTANAPFGSPYVNFTLSGTSLAPGAAAAVILNFVDPSNATISYTSRILAGAGTR